MFVRLFDARVHKTQSTLSAYQVCGATLAKCSISIFLFVLETKQKRYFAFKEKRLGYLHCRLPAINL